MFLQVTFPRGGPGAEGVPTAGKRQQGLPTQAPGLMCGSTEYAARAGFRLELWKERVENVVAEMFLPARWEGSARPEQRLPGKQSEPSC